MQFYYYCFRECFLYVHSSFLYSFCFFTFMPFVKIPICSCKFSHIGCINVMFYDVFIKVDFVIDTFDYVLNSIAFFEQNISIPFNGWFNFPSSPIKF